MLKQEYIMQLQRSRRYSPKTLSFLMGSKTEDVNISMIMKLIFSLHRDPEVDKSHAFLIFLPGWDDISGLDQLLKDEKLAFAVRTQKVLHCNFICDLLALSSLSTLGC